MTLPILPTLKWRPTPASNTRVGVTINIIVVHRWGVRYSGGKETAIEYEGVQNYFMDPANRASAHLVYPGSAVAGEATQMVSWAEMAWGEAAYNPVADEVESADAHWPDALPAGVKPDAEGLAVLARIVACRLHARGLPPIWSTQRGFCRHADLGAAGGGHPDCPTVDVPYWRGFVKLVQQEYARSGCLNPWGR